VTYVDLAMPMSQRLKNARTGVRSIQAVTWLLDAKRFFVQAERERTSQFILQGSVHCRALLEDSSPNPSGVVVPLVGSLCVRTRRPTTRRETMKTTAPEACGAPVTGILSLAVGHRERVRPLPFLCSLHMIETVDAPVVLFHDNTGSTRHNHCGVT
jgi:hypothetical protein